MAEPDRARDCAKALSRLPSVEAIRMTLSEKLIWSRVKHDDGSWRYTLSGLDDAAQAILAMLKAKESNTHG